METGKMELNQEQMEQVSGSLVCNDAAPAPREGCKHPNKVKTPWWGREYDYILWTQHQNAYLCPDCREIVWVSEEP